MAKKLSAKENFIQTVKFTLFSCSAGIIQAVSFTLMNELAKFPYWPAYLIALILSVLFNFTVNRRYTFKSAANIPVAMLKVFGYYCVFTPVTTILGDYFADTLLVNEYIVLGVTMLLNFVTEFLFCRFVVYRKSINTNDIAAREEDKKQQ